MPNPTRTDVDTWPGLTLLEFGTPWCPICQAARPSIDDALADTPTIRHVMVEDGRGRPLGRSYRVTLWPTLILLVDGQETGRVVRPTGQNQVQDLLGQAPPACRHHPVVDLV